MKLEILDFYPKEKAGDGFISGDIKIRLPDLKISMLGIYAARRTNGKWLILLPCRTAIDSTGSKVRFPVVHFDDADHKKLMAALYETVPVYVEERLKDTSKPLVFPLTKSSSPKAPPGDQSNQAKVKPFITSAKAKAAAPAKSGPKIFKDLPPRPPITRGRASG